MTQLHRGNLWVKWWSGIDRASVFTVLFLMLTGYVLNLAVSDYRIEYLGVQDFLLIKHFVFLVISSLFLLSCSMLPFSTVKKFGVVLFVLAFVMTIMTIFWGLSAGGAMRWLSLFGFSFQPSEFLKPGFIIVSGLLLARYAHTDNIRYVFFSFVILLMVLFILALQPDFGQSVLLLVSWGGMLFLSGITLWVIFGGIALAFIFCIIGYFLHSHVRQRVNAFLFPQEGSEWGINHQTNKAIEAFAQAGWLGEGPGSGIVKNSLPAPETDFIFAVAGEEYGFIACSLIVLAFLFLIMNAFLKARKQHSLDNILIISGMAMLLFCQAIIHMSVNLGLLPAKGMTLPFISYGGSSLMAVGITVGILFALTRSSGVSDSSVKGT